MVVLVPRGLFFWRRASFSGVLWLMRILKPSGYLPEKYKIVFKGSSGLYQKTLEITYKKAVLAPL